MKITIEINNNEDVTEAIQTLEKLLVTTTTKKPAAKKTSKKPTTKAKSRDNAKNKQYEFYGFWKAYQ